MTLLPLFIWLENSGIGRSIRDSTWLFPWIESVHLVALSVLGGAVLIVDLRLLGVTLQKQPLNVLARDAYPWMVGSLLIMLVTGIALFLSEATKCFFNPPFWVKMACLLLAMIFTFTVWRKVTRAPEGHVGAGRMKFVAIVSLVLWFGVGAGGRGIGFY
jgi:uncharacterized membrane protein YhdT